MSVEDSEDGKKLMDYPCHVESGLQFMWRNCKRPNLNSVYPELFQNGPNWNSVIELVYDAHSHHSALLCEIISNALLPEDFGGKQAGVVFIVTDGHFNLIQLIGTLYHFARKGRNISEFISPEEHECAIETAVAQCLDSIQILNVFDSEQMCITIHNLEHVIHSHDRISLVVVDTISAFYWADRMIGSSMVKMDTYVKKLLKTLQEASWEYKSVILYTRPSYFVSQSNVGSESELCVKDPAMEKVNFRVSMRLHQEQRTCKENADADDEVVIVSVTSSTGTIVKNIKVKDFEFQWI